MPAADPDNRHGHECSTVCTRAKSGRRSAETRGSQAASRGFVDSLKMRNGMRPGEEVVTRPLGVVVTGGTAGLGLAMARMFLLRRRPGGHLRT